MVGFPLQNPNGGVFIKVILRHNVCSAYALELTVS